jgi:hypothetical protein
VLGVLDDVELELGVALPPVVLLDDEDGVVLPPASDFFGVDE